MAAKWVTKKNGDLEKFSKVKLIKGMKKSGCGVKDAEWIVKKVSAKCYDKISTRKIGLMVIAFLRKEDPKAAVAFNKVFTKNWRHL
jgi:transcriptional regulator NrdR family protein